MKVYIVGSVLGIENWEHKFIEAKEKLLEWGVTVLCPLDYPPGLNLKEYMVLSAANVFLADTILVLPGYENSVGTNAEIVLADSIMTPVIFNIRDVLH